MKRLVDLLDVVVGVIAFAVAIWQLIVFVTYQDAQGRPDMMAGINHLWLGLVALVVAIACGVIYYIRHVKPIEEIHITE